MVKLWGNSSKKPAEAAKKPEAEQEEQKRTVVAKPAEFYDTMRSSAFLNKGSNIAQFLQFWLAVKEENDKDEWTVTRFYVYKDAKDSNGNGEIQSENASANKRVVSFVEALSILGQAEMAARQAPYMQPIADVEALYPIRDFPFFEGHYHDVEHFAKVGDIEGYVFDDLYRPHNRTRGRVVADDADFTHESFKPVDPAQMNARALAHIEGGFVRDVFNVAADKTSKLEDNMRAFALLKHMDDFAFHAGVFYLSMQKALGAETGFDGIRGMTPQFKKQLLDKSAAHTVGDFGSVLSSVVPKMTEVLEKCKAQNVKGYTEPFEKFVAECEMYVYMAKSDRLYRPIKAGAQNPGGVDMEALAEVRENVEKAKQKFMALGGSAKHAQAIESWVYNAESKGSVNESIAEFLSRYYEAREKAVKRFAAKGFTPAADMANMTAATKPSLTAEGIQPKKAAL
jgi:hypothetical protein